MAFLAPILLPTLSALLTSGFCAWLWRPSLPRPALFGVLGFLLLLGLHRVLQAAWEIIAAATAGGYFLERPTTASAIEAVERQLTTQALTLAALLVALGVPLLYAFRGMVRS